jgi:alpha-amylase
MKTKVYPLGRRKFLPASVAFLLLLFSIASIAADHEWWTNAVFYEVFVRSYQDSNGDGIGDLRGLIDRLDYLNDGDQDTTDDLGVTALWLMPIYESPSYHGYDVTDYYAVEPDYGTLDDFRELLDAAHSHGISVVVDLVLNHTSSEHPWFRASRSVNSDFRHWYVWSTELPNTTGPWGQRVWHFGGAGYYYGIFWSGMPDLNYRNPAVSTQMFDVVRFWLDEVGVDGFRLDAIRHLIETGEQQENTPATHFWLKGFGAVSKGWSPDALLLGEVWDAPGAILPYYDAELDICFEFSLADAILNGVRGSNAGTIEDALRVVLETYPPGQYATFLSNHDQERVMTRLLGSTAKAKLAASILLTLPGTPFVYYGEEIGMTGAKPDERIRTPMQWSDAPGGGFTDGTPWEPSQADASERTVASQLDDPDSLLSTYRRLIHLREGTDLLRSGATVLVETGHLSLLSYLRSSGERTLWVVHNLAAFPAQPSRLVAETAVLPPGAYRAVDRLDGAREFTFELAANGHINWSASALEPYHTLILELRPTTKGS